MAKKMLKEPKPKKGKLLIVLTGLTAAIIGLTSCLAPVKEQVTPAPVKPTETPAPEPTPTKEATPTPASAMEMGVSEMELGGETDISRGFDAVRRLPVSKGDIELENPGVILLTPKGSSEQPIVRFQKDGRTWILGNFNLPVFQEGQVEYQPVFNTPDFGQLMGWVDNEGNWLYHIPLQPGVEGKAPVVYQRNNQLYEGLVDLTTGKIDPASEKPYWQPMPEKAVKAVMAKFGNAVYVTFWDREGNQLTDKTIKVCDLPPEPTPTPEIKPLDLPGLDEVWNFQNGRWEYRDVDNQVVAYWDAENQRIEITATTLTEKHLGLFTPVSPQEAQRLFEERFVDSRNFDFVFPVDVSKCRYFTLALFQAEEGETQAVFALELPMGARFVAPTRGKAANLSWSTNELVNLLSADLKSNFLVFYMGGGKVLVPSEGFNKVEVGSALMEVVDSSRLALINAPGTEKYNALIAASMYFSLDFKDLIKDESGRIFYLRQ